MEKLAGVKFKDNICDILIATGFDSKTAMKSFSNPQTFSQIEKYINENQLKFTEILKGTKYENSNPFKFLPGHITLLSSLPELLTELKTNKAKANELQLEQSNQNSIQLADNSQNIEPSNQCDEHDTNQNSYDTEKIQDLKKRLVKKINDFSSKKNIGIVITEDNIKNFRVVNQLYKCSVQCPKRKCPKVVPCNFEKNWSCGNFQSHFKWHKSVEASVEEYEVNEDNILEKVSHTSMNIVRISNGSHLKSLSNL